MFYTNQCQWKLDEYGLYKINLLSKLTVIHYTNITTFSVFWQYVSCIWISFICPKLFNPILSPQQSLLLQIIARSQRFSFLFPFFPDSLFTNNVFRPTIPRSNARFLFQQDAFDCGVWMDVHINFFVESNRAPAFFVTDDVFGTGASDSSFLCRTPYCHALASTSTADLTVNGSVKANNDFASLPYSYPFQREEKNEILPTLNNMLLSGHYARHTQPMIPQSSLKSFRKDVPPPAKVKVRVIQVATGPKVSTFETTGTPSRLTKFDVAHCHHQDLLFRVNQNEDTEISLLDISDAYAHFLARSIRAYGLKNARKTLFFTITATENRPEAFEGASSGTTCFLDKDPIMVLLHEKNRRHVLCDLQKTRHLAPVEALLLVQCDTRQNSRPVAKTEAFKLIKLTNKVTSIVRCDSSFIAVIKSVVNFREAFKKKHGISFLAAWIADIVNDMLWSDFLTGNCRQTYRRYIQATKLLLQRLIILNIIKDIDGEEAGTRSHGISLLDGGTTFSSWTEQVTLQFRAASNYVRNRMKLLPSHAPSFYKSRNGLLRKLRSH